MERKCGDEALAAVAGLAEPIRRRLYDFVAGQAEPVGRDDAAAAVGITRSLAGYHLDRLVEDGLLEPSYVRRTGRRGPGAGRPAKLYRPAATEITVQLPARDDALVAHLLATAVEADATGRARDALRTATRAAGQALGAELGGGDVFALLEARGYAPIEEPEGIRLRNCPFHHLVGEHLDLVCALNEDLLGAAVEAAGGGWAARLDPQPGRCCVVLHQT